MKIGRVAGTVVTTICSPGLEGRKLLSIDLLDLDGNTTGKDLIAVDAVGAGAGETVLILDEGNGARQVLEAPDAPIRAVIVGVIDELTISE
ncbi:MAG: EutN/CcmL family microcompartment protein [Acidobacteria bacterium]|nr:EutN/CcmL family microcompartment protein [Candidatus Sulfomarinibacter kjeldsenii]